MISLLADLSDPAFSGEMDSLVEAYRGAGVFILTSVWLLRITTERPANRRSRRFPSPDRGSHGLREEGLRVMLASDLAPNSFEAGRRKKVESICGWPHDMRGPNRPHL